MATPPSNGSQRAEERINLLLNQAASTTFEGERNVCIVKARDLRDKYEISGATSRRVERALRGELSVEIAPDPQVVTAFASWEDAWDSLVGYGCRRCGGTFRQRDIHFTKRGWFCPVCFAIRQRMTAAERNREDRLRRYRDEDDYWARWEEKWPRLEAFMREHGMDAEADQEMEQRRKYERSKKRRRA